MAEVKVLKHSVVISGKSFEDCKAEYERICKGVKKILVWNLICRNLFLAI